MKMSDEHKKKISLALKGRKGLSGKLNPRYIDGRRCNPKSCIDCKKQLRKYTLAKRCRDCDNKFHTGINSRRYVDGGRSVKRFCKCGNSISYTSWKYRKGLCQSCSQKGKIRSIESRKKQGLKVAGKLNPMWKDGKRLEKYPFEFDLRIKNIIKKRDNNKCIKCNISEEEHIIVFKRKLCVHHIDYDKNNCNHNNLITLCCSCHSRTNYNRNYWEKFYKNIIS